MEGSDYVIALAIVGGIYAIGVITLASVVGWLLYRLIRWLKK